MSMFDSKLHRHIYEWGEMWGSKERKFRDHVRIEATENGILLKIRGNNRTAEFLRLPQEDWEAGVRAASVSSRLGNSESIKFFLYHWLEERNMLTNLFKQLEELNA